MGGQRGACSCHTVDTQLACIPMRLDISLILMRQVHVKDERNPSTTADNTACHQLSTIRT